MPRLQTPYRGVPASLQKRGLKRPGVGGLSLEIIVDDSGFKKLYAELSPAHVQKAMREGLNDVTKYLLGEIKAIWDSRQRGTWEGKARRSLDRRIVYSTAGRLGHTIGYFPRGGEHPYGAGHTVADYVYHVEKGTKKGYSKLPNIDRLAQWAAQRLGLQVDTEAEELKERIPLQLWAYLYAIRKKGTQAYPAFFRVVREGASGGFTTVLNSPYGAEAASRWRAAMQRYFDRVKRI